MLQARSAVANLINVCPIPATVLGLAHYPSVMELLQPRVKREVATKIVQVGADSNKFAPDVRTVLMLLQLRLIMRLI